MPQRSLDQTTYLYGQSDDLIELTGGINEEFTAYYEERTYLIFSNGVVLSIAYDGEWNIQKHAVPTDVSVTIRAPGDGEHARDYSDEAVISGEPTNIDWVAKADTFRRA